MNFLFAIAAFCYAAAGHGGASAYLPLSLASGLNPVQARSVALLLNLLVAGMAGISFALAGWLRPKLLWPLLLGSMPLAFLGSRLVIHSHWLGTGLGFAMLWGAWRFTLGRESKELAPDPAPAWPILLSVGAALGLLSGFTGIGGGIYLSPLLLFKRWATAKEAAALAACFIWFNSMVSLFSTGISATPGSACLAACFIGGLAGATLGARKFSPVALRRALACVLVAAAYKALL